MDDYLTSELSGIIYTPISYDAIVVFSKDTNLLNHNKGYLMMEIIPSETAEKIFSQEEYQKMEYIKPYLLSIFEKVLKLMEKNIFITDLKLANTLYDIY